MILRSKPLAAPVVFVLVFMVGQMSPPLQSATVPGETAIATSDDPPHTSDGDDRLRRADLHVNNGRQFYFQGNTASAHREFDAAVDALLAAPDSLADHRRIERRLEEICDLIYRFDVEKLGAGQTSDEQVAFDKAPIDEISNMTFPADEKVAAKLKNELHKTASGIPWSSPILCSATSASFPVTVDAPFSWLASGVPAATGP